MCLLSCVLYLTVILGGSGLGSVGSAGKAHDPTMRCYLKEIPNNQKKCLNCSCYKTITHASIAGELVPW